MKKLIMIPLTALALLALLAACGGDAADDPEVQEQQRAQVTRELQSSGNLHPNADLDFSQDEDGNLTFNYDNPDGTGGGGVVLD